MCVWADVVGIPTVVDADPMGSLKIDFSLGAGCRGAVSAAVLDLSVNAAALTDPSYDTLW